MSGLGGKVWQVHKFGGTSVANAECFIKAAIIAEEQLGIHYSPNHPKNENNTTPINLAVVVSAMGGKPKVTDLLLDSVKAAADRDDEKVNTFLGLIIEKHSKCLEELAVLSTSVSSTLIQRIQSDISDIRDILKTVSLMKWQAARISELVSGYGETWSAQILSALLSARSAERFSSQSSSADGTYHHFRYVDARRVIIIDEEAIKDGAICWEKSKINVQNVYQEELNHLSSTLSNNSDSAVSSSSSCSNDITMHLVITGYIASNTQGVATTLQRDGSDFSASIMGRLLEACAITIWTDVDGVLSADPRRVPGSYVLPEVSFNEAMELAYFGAKVIHPKTMQPAILHPQIPIYIRNTFNSSFRGSRIFTSSTTHTDRDRCVCGFSSIEKMALINVEGSGMVGVKGVARRLFGTLESCGVNVVLISQASSEHSITFATSMEAATRAKIAIEEEFHKEIKQNHITSIEVVSPCSIIAAVGDGMHFTTGVSGRFFSALGDAKINILAISQGSSERNISAVVLESESTRALRAVHAAFRLSHTVVRIGIVGMNDIGVSLLQLLETRRQVLNKVFELDLQVCAVYKDSQSSDFVSLKNDMQDDSITQAAYDFATGGSFLLGASAASISFQSTNNEKTNLVKVQDGDFISFGKAVYSEDNPHSFIFDCTADEKIGEKHIDWMKQGVNIVTANNTVLSGSKIIRDELKVLENDKKAKYLREVTVGGGLPILSTLRDLLNSGDTIRRIDGIISVTMSYVMFRIAPPPGNSECEAFDERLTLGAFREDRSMSPKLVSNVPCTFSQAMKEAIALGLTEEDPIHDLNNEYTARVLMVLAKELGLDETYDVSKIQSQSESLISNDKLYSEVESEINEKMRLRVQEASSRHCVLRHISSIDVKTGKISIALVDVPHNHVFATTPPSCGCVRFFTKRHKRYPLVVQGPTAGADSTASALLAELLNLMRHNVQGPHTGALSRSSSKSLF